MCCQIGQKYYMVRRIRFQHSSPPERRERQSCSFKSLLRFVYDWYTTKLDISKIPPEKIEEVRSPGRTKKYPSSPNQSATRLHQKLCQTTQAHQHLERNNSTRTFHLFLNAVVVARMLFALAESRGQMLGKVAGISYVVATATTYSST